MLFTVSSTASAAMEKANEGYALADSALSSAKLVSKGQKLVSDKLTSSGFVCATDLKTEVEKIILDTAMVGKITSKILEADSDFMKELKKPDNAVFRSLIQNHLETALNDPTAPDSLKKAVRQAAFNGRLDDTNIERVIAFAGKVDGLERDINTLKGLLALKPLADQLKEDSSGEFAVQFKTTVDVVGRMFKPASSPSPTVSYLMPPDLQRELQGMHGRLQDFSGTIQDQRRLLESYHKDLERLAAELVEAKKVPMKAPSSIDLLLDKGASPSARYEKGPWQDRGFCIVTDTWLQSRQPSGSEFFHTFKAYRDGSWWVYTQTLSSGGCMSPGWYRIISEGHRRKYLAYNPEINGNQWIYLDADFPRFIPG